MREAVDESEPLIPVLLPREKVEAIAMRGWTSELTLACQKALGQ